LFFKIEGGQKLKQDHKARIAAFTDATVQAPETASLLTDKSLRAARKSKIQAEEPLYLNRI
jgi:hypothetical protein